MLVSLDIQLADRVMDGCVQFLGSGGRRTAAKRDARSTLLPSRQQTVRHASASRCSAKALTETGLWSGPRRSRDGGRPLPVHVLDVGGLGGKGPSPGCQTLSVGGPPTTSARSGADKPAQKAPSAGRRSAGWPPSNDRCWATDRLTATWQLFCLPIWPQTLPRPPSAGPFWGTPCPRRSRPEPGHAAHDRRRMVAHPGQHRLVRPRRPPNEVQPGRMLGRHPRRCRHGRHRLHAFALQRHQQATTIVPQRTDPVGTADHLDQMIDMGRKRRFTLLCPPIHFNSLRSIADATGLSPQAN